MDEPRSGVRSLAVGEEMKDWGWRLRAARAARGLTEDALAGEMRRWAELLGTPRPEITGNAIVGMAYAGSRSILISSYFASVR